MAITLMGGLLVGTVLTLLFLPTLYAFWFRVHRPKGVAVPPADTGPAIEIQARRQGGLLTPGK
jgi:hypothetical protein